MDAIHPTIGSPGDRQSDSAATAGVSPTPSLARQGNSQVERLIADRIEDLDFADRQRPLRRDLELDVSGFRGDSRGQRVGESGGGLVIRQHVIDQNVLLPQIQCERLLAGVLHRIRRHEDFHPIAKLAFQGIAPGPTMVAGTNCFDICRNFRIGWKP